MLRISRGALLVLAGLLLSTGCSDDDDSDALPETTSTTAAASSTTATTATTGAAAKKLTTSGFGALTLGMTLDKAKAEGLVTNIRAGCELAGPGQMSAEVSGTPDAYVTFDDGKLIAVELRQGETAEGLGVGATIDQAKQTYSTNGFSVTVDEAPVEVFGFISVAVKRNGADAYEFAAAPETKKIEQLSAPHMMLCD